MSEPASRGFCSRHKHMMADRLKFLGLWPIVDRLANEDKADIMRAWMAGQLRREFICPLTIMALELQSKADRVAGGHVLTCPLCSLVRLFDDETDDVKEVNGYADLMLGLCQTNGLIGGTPAKAIAIRLGELSGRPWGNAST